MQPLISFGVYVVVAALLGVVATVSVGFIAPAPVTTAIQQAHRNWPGVVLVVALVASAVITLQIVLAFL